MSESALDELVALFARLRRECNWKAAQTHTSLTRYLIEEAYETVEAIESGDPDAVREELGDLLLQVYFHATIAEEAGQYSVQDVAADLREKLIRRNPHVFESGGPKAESAHDINEVWQAVKATEKQRNHVMEGVPVDLPALLLADKAIDRLSRAGAAVHIDPDSTDLGERLLSLVAEAHAEGADPEQALRAAVRRRLDAVPNRPV